MQLPALPQGLGPVPYCLRNASSLRLSASRDPSSLLAGNGIHRLLATDQHLLERFHGPALLQSGGLPAQAMAPAPSAGSGHAHGLPGHMDAARVPVVLA